jgi:hypothetical protein
VVIGAEHGGAGRLDASFVERLRRLVRAPILSIVAKADRQPMSSPEPFARFQDLASATA